MDVAELIARESIRDLVARYNASGDSGRFDQLLDLFWDDAVMEVPGAGTFAGHAEIRAMFTGTADRFRDDRASSSSSSEPPMPGAAGYVRHTLSTLVIDFDDPNHARGYAYFAVIMAHGLDHWGRYFDRYEARAGVWKFAHRRAVGEGRRDDPAP
jgi:SnoaL-like domain